MDGCKGMLSVDIAIILALPTPVSTEAFFSHFFDWVFFQRPFTFFLSGGLLYFWISHVSVDKGRKELGVLI